LELPATVRIDVPMTIAIVSIRMDVPPWLFGGFSWNRNQRITLLTKQDQPMTASRGERDCGELRGKREVAYLAGTLMSAPQDGEGARHELPTKTLLSADEVID
jgi:hypothetical protein